MTTPELLKRIEEIRLNTGNTKLTIKLRDGEQITIVGEKSVKCLWKILNKENK